MPPAAGPAAQAARARRQPSSAASFFFFGSSREKPSSSPGTAGHPRESGTPAGDCCLSQVLPAFGTQRMLDSPGCCCCCCCCRLARRNIAVENTPGPAAAAAAATAWLGKEGNSRFHCQPSSSWLCLPLPGFPWRSALPSPRLSGNSPRFLPAGFLAESSERDAVGRGNASSMNAKLASAAAETNPTSSSDKPGAFPPPTYGFPRAASFLGVCWRRGRGQGEERPAAGCLLAPAPPPLHAVLLGFSLAARARIPALPSSPLEEMEERLARLQNLQDRTPEQTSCLALAQGPVSKLSRSQLT